MIIQPRFSKRSAPVLPAMQGCPRGANQRNGAPCRLVRLLNEGDDLELLGGEISHLPLLHPRAFFLSSRFSRVASAKTSLRAVASAYNSCTSTPVAYRAVSRPDASCHTLGPPSTSCHRGFVQSLHGCGARRALLAAQRCQDDADLLLQRTPLAGTPADILRNLLRQSCF